MRTWMLLSALLLTAACGDGDEAAAPARSPTPPPEPTSASSPAPSTATATASPEASPTAVPTPQPSPTAEPRAPLETVTLAAARDATLYEDARRTLANGRGQQVFTGVNKDGGRRRALLAFDLAGRIPAGAEITEVRLTLHLSRTSSGSQRVSLLRVLAPWGEGASDPTGEEGGGAAATAGDVTWVHRLLPGALWERPGGDFAAEPSASADVAGPGAYVWGPSAGLAADVQRWLDDPGSNQGWLLLGAEPGPRTSKRFGSREHPNAELRPLLTVEFRPPPGVGE